MISFTVNNANKIDQIHLQCIFTSVSSAVVTCDIQLFQNYFILRRRPSEIILPEIISKLFQRLMNIFQHVQCH